MGNAALTTPLALYPALSGLPPSLLTEAIHNTMAVPTGGEVFSEDQPCQGFPLLLSGRIKVVKNTASGRELLLYRVEPGGSCVISSSCLLGRTNYTARGIAETPLRLAVLPPVLFWQLIGEHPPFRDFVFHLFAKRIAELMVLVEEVAFARLDQRLAKLLLARHLTELSVTHQQLADELGSVREIVSRLLKGFAAQGLVDLGRERITLLNRAALQAIALV